MSDLYAYLFFTYRQKEKAAKTKNGRDAPSLPLLSNTYIL